MDVYIGLPNPNILMPLKKLHITKKDVSGDQGFDVLYNPERYVQKREVHYSDKAGISTDMPITQFSHGTAEILEFSLFSKHRSHLSASLIRTTSI